MQANQFHQLLDDFKGLSSPIKDPTFMEIAGYPHYENVCSNILEFYFQPDAAHGLSDLCLKALLALAPEPDDEPQSSVTVEREVATKKGRIDIVIESEAYLIGIENKIYHLVNNPLEDYACHLEKRRGNRKLILFILSLYPVEDQDLHSFISIQYSDFFSKLRPLMGDYIARAKTKFLISLTDFMETIENLREGTSMDQNVIKLFQERSSEITSMLEEVNKFKAELRRKVSELKQIIDFQNQPVSIEQKFYRKERMLLDQVFYEIPLTDKFCPVVVCQLSTQGWTVLAFNRKGDFDKVRFLFNTLHIPFEERSDGTRLIHPIIYPYDEPLDTIQKVAQGWINKIGQSNANG